MELPAGEVLVASGPLTDDGAVPTDTTVWVLLPRGLSVRASDFPYFDAPTPVGLAHRGGAGYGPNVGLENTLAAFRRAVSMGYRYLETDVHATRDGQVVAFHDTVLDRVSDGRGAIAALPYEAVSEARIGGAEPIPLLSHLFEEFPDTRINIDIKADDALVPTVREVLRHNATDRVCIGSFCERRLRAARAALGPQVATAAGQVGTALLRFSPAALSRMLHTPAPVLQLPDAAPAARPHGHPGHPRAGAPRPRPRQARARVVPRLVSRGRLRDAPAARPGRRRHRHRPHRRAARRAGGTGTSTHPTRLTCED